MTYVNSFDLGQNKSEIGKKPSQLCASTTKNAVTMHRQKKKYRITNTLDVKMHPTEEKRLFNLKKRKGNIMRKLVNKLTASKKFNRYCVNVLKMYNYGRVNMPV